MLCGIFSRLWRKLWRRAMNDISFQYGLPFQETKLTLFLSFSYGCLSPVGRFPSLQNQDPCRSEYFVMRQQGSRYLINWWQTTAKKKSDLLRFLDIQLIFSVESWPERIFSQLGIVLGWTQTRVALADNKYSHVNMSAEILDFKTKPEDCHNIYTTAHKDCILANISEFKCREYMTCRKRLFHA